MSILTRLARAEKALKDRNPDVWNKPFGSARPCTPDEWFEAVDYFEKTGELPPHGEDVSFVLSMTEAAFVRKVCELEGHPLADYMRPGDLYCPGCRPFYHSLATVYQSKTQPCDCEVCETWRAGGTVPVEDRLEGDHPLDKIYLWVKREREAQRR